MSAGRTAGTGSLSRCSGLLRAGVLRLTAVCHSPAVKRAHLLHDARLVRSRQTSVRAMARRFEADGDPARASTLSAVAEELAEELRRIELVLELERPAGHGRS